jgi:hypothetical protein
MGSRRKGSLGKTPANVWKLLAERGDRDPLDVLSEFTSSNCVDPALRIQAATALSGYRHGKRSAQRWISNITGMDAPRSVEDATAYIARISELMVTGKIDVDAGAAVVGTLQSYIDAKVGSDLEQRMQAAEVLIAELLRRGVGAAVVVEGGMPPLPLGPSDRPVIMPNTGPSTFEGKPNPWSAPDVRSEVRVIPKRSGRPPKGFKYGPAVKPPDDPDDDPESS